MLFATVNGGGLTRVNFVSLAPTTVVDANVIDSWASLLNAEEHRRDPDKPFRLFFKTSLTVMFLCNLYMFFASDGLIFLCFICNTG